MALLGWVPGTESQLPDPSQPRFIHNTSGRFESRWATVQVQDDSPAIMLKVIPAAAYGAFLPALNEVDSKSELMLMAVAYIVKATHNELTYKQGPAFISASVFYNHGTDLGPDAWAALAMISGKRSRIGISTDRPCTAAELQHHSNKAFGVMLGMLACAGYGGKQHGHLVCAWGGARPLP